MPEIKSKIQNLKSKIILNKRIKNNYFKMVIFCPQITKYALPGQFVSIRITDSYQPLLRRPFSIHRIKGGDLEILYEIRGKGTEILSKKKPNQSLDIIGPLGNGFDLNKHTSSKNSSAILVAGGIGVAPLVFLAERLAKSKPWVLLGAPTKEKILCEEEFKKIGCKVKISTDDGSRGFKGKVTALLRNFITHYHLHITPVIYACGPRPMLKEIAFISQRFGVSSQVCLEEHMACGIGVCLGCVIPTQEGNRRVCKDGPVFKTKELIW